MSDEGFLVLADISGFTAFVTNVELEHGAQVISVLLETVIDRLAPPLEIQELEGDAVFAIGADHLVDSRRVPTALIDAFRGFKETQRKLALDDSCSCGACRQTAYLNLKLIAHHGRFVRQTVGGRSRVAGPDVILAHRLLKNPVDATGYFLFTGPALERAGVDPDASHMERRLISYAYLGEMPCFVAHPETGWQLTFVEPTVEVA
jgi:Protein of unknown function (DUF2652)